MTGDLRSLSLAGRKVRDESGVRMSGSSLNCPSDRLWWTRLGFYLAAAVMLVTLGFSGSGEKGPPFADAADHWYFFLIGVLAATVANSTGAGGGIVFLPVFTLLGLSVTESLATSFAIQCFGMTAGGLSWLQHLRQGAKADEQSGSFRLILLVGAMSALVGLRMAQELVPEPGWDIEWFFSLFSLLVGVIIFVKTLKNHDVNGGRKDGIQTANWPDWQWLDPWVGPSRHGCRSEWGKCWRSICWRFDSGLIWRWQLRFV